MRYPSSLLALATSSLTLMGCQPTPERAPCADFDCSGHGLCTLLQTRSGPVPTCLCDAGYSPTASGWLCLPVEDDSLCADVTCSGHGRCISARGEAQCVCDAGYVQIGRTSCVDPCAGVTCSGHGTCKLAGSAARCECAVGYRASSDGRSCTEAWPEPSLSYVLLYDKVPEYVEGLMALELSEGAAGKLTEVIKYGEYLDHQGGGVYRLSRTVFQLNAGGTEISSAEVDEEFTEGKVSRRRRTTASFSGGTGSVTLQRLGRSATLSLSYQGKQTPLVMSGSWEYPGWTFGCFSPVFYRLALQRYDASKKGRQELEVFWPEAAMVGTIAVEADPRWTDSQPVLTFLDDGITVTYEEGDAISIELPSMKLGWWRTTGTPFDLNLSPSEAATPHQPAPLPTDVTETSLSFPSSDGTLLAGTLARPQTPSGSRPAVLLVSGLGAENRDAPFSRLPQALLYKHLAAQLAHAGYISLRVDPRGNGSSQGQASQLSLAQLTQDAATAYDVLATSAQVDPSRIYLLTFGRATVIGVSLLGKRALRGYLALAPLLKDMDQVVVFAESAHMKAAGFSASFIDKQLSSTRKDMTAIADGTFAEATWNEWPTAFWKELLLFDGSAALGAFSGPVLALRGEADQEVPAAQLEAVATAATKAGKLEVQTQTLTGLTHVLTAALPSDPLWEAAVLPFDLAPAALTAVLSWLGQN